MSQIVRYRTETFSGSGVRNVIDVIWYEIFVLGNADILDCLSRTILRHHTICSSLIQYQQELENNGFIDDMIAAESRDLIRCILEAIYEETGNAICYGLWLADLNTVKDLYRGKDASIDIYHTGPVILSDLGYDGTLYGYEKAPERLN